MEKPENGRPVTESFYKMYSHLADEEDGALKGIGGYGTVHMIGLYNIQLLLESILSKLTHLSKKSRQENSERR